MVLRSDLALLRILHFFISRFIHIYLVSYVSFACAPFEKVVKYFDAVLFLDYPVVLELVVLCHLEHVFLNVFVYILAK